MSEQAGPRSHQGRKGRSMEFDELYRLMDQWEGMGLVRLKSGQRHTPDAIYEKTELGKLGDQIVKDMRREERRAERMAMRSAKSARPRP